jgi:hypothetical protein
MKDLEASCYWFREGAVQKNTTLIKEWINVQIERGAKVVENQVEPINPKIILTYPEGIKPPTTLKIEGKFECLEPSCITRGIVRTAYPQHNTSGFLPSQPDTYYAAYDPMRSLYYEVEVVGDSTPLCQTREYREKQEERRKKLIAGARRRKQERLAKENSE